MDLIMLTMVPVTLVACVLALMWGIIHFIEWVDPWA
jgi:hypothetical protein